MSVKVKNKKSADEPKGRVVGFSADDHMVIEKGGKQKIVHRVHGEKLLGKGLGYSEVTGVEIESRVSAHSTKDIIEQN